VTPTAGADRSIYRANLVGNAQGVLNQLPGASEYSLDLILRNDLQQLNGKETVRYTNREGVPLNEIYFRLFPNLMGGKMELSDLSIDGQTANFQLEQQNSAARIVLPSPLQPDRATTLQLNFSTTIPGSSNNNYNTFSNTDGVLALADFYPLIPAYDASGWHTEIPKQYGDMTYTDTSFYQVRLTAPAALKVVLSGEVSQPQVQGQQQVLTAVAGPVRDFYMAASDRYVETTEKIGETTVHSYAFAEFQVAGKEALDFARKAFSTYQKWFGEYPYTEFKIAATPTSALGVEYPQVVVITQKLYDPNSELGGASQRVYFESTVAHEIAHQWFYGLVGDDQLNQPWLDESMAQYDTYLYYLDNAGSAAADGFKSSWDDRWGRVNRAATPIGLPVAAYTEQSYGAIVYGRGPLFLDALDQQMGEPKFKTFMKDYFQDYEWGIATTAGFEQLATKDCGCDLSGLFKEWVGE
jgi:hypothetical protein